jgi:hypothetical protein
LSEGGLLLSSSTLIEGQVAPAPPQPLLAYYATNWIKSRLKRSFKRSLKRSEKNAEKKK